jgi:hypothetical protein
MERSATAGKRYSGEWLRLFTGDWASVGKFLGVAVQLGLLVLVIGQFRLENPVFYDRILPLTFFGFLIHSFLASRYRLPFFLLLSLAGIFSAFGWLSSAWLIGIGLVLIGLCHLPVPFWFRLAALIVVGGGLALLRMDRFAAPWSTDI